MVKYCKNCEYIECDGQSHWCTNPDSQHCADWVNEKDTCPCWAEQNVNYVNGNRRSV